MSHHDSENVARFLSPIYRLKGTGTTIIVAVHDDRIPGCADLLPHMKDGRIVKGA